MSRRIVVHAGFHKTGTTTIQNTLRAHAEVLRPVCRVLLRPDMVALCEAARTWSVTRSAVDLGLIQYEAADLAQVWATDDRPVLISSEDLAGHMPGRRGLTRYDAAPQIIAAICTAVQAALPEADIVIVFFTRAREAWLRSCYAQHLRATRITLDADAYAKAFAASADLAAVVAAVEAGTGGLAHGVEVVSHALEDHIAHPCAPLLQSMGCTQVERFAPVAPANTAPPQAMMDAMLALNRADMSDAAWRAAKSSLRRSDF